MRIRDYITWRDYFWWTLLIFSLAGRWLIPYLLSRELAEPSRILLLIEDGLSVVTSISGGICFIGAFFRPGFIEREFSWKAGFAGSLGLIVLFGSFKLIPSPWEVGKFHFLKSHCQAETVRDFAKWCRNQIDATKDPKAEADHLQATLFEQPGPFPEIAELWDAPPTCNFHHNATGLVWSAGLFSRHWGLLIMDDPNSAAKVPGDYREWEQGVYFWMQP